MFLVGQVDDEPKIKTDVMKPKDPWNRFIFLCHFQLFGHKTLGVMYWIMTLAVAISVFGNNITGGYRASRYETCFLSRLRLRCDNGEKL